jgi:hypothetical protein
MQTAKYQVRVIEETHDSYHCSFKGGVAKTTTVHWLLSTGPIPTLD